MKLNQIHRYSVMVFQIVLRYDGDVQYVALVLCFFFFFT